MTLLLDSVSHSRDHELAACRTWRLVSNFCPCSRSTFNEPSSVSLQALSRQLPRRLIKAVMAQVQRIALVEDSIAGAGRLGYACGLRGPAHALTIRSAFGGRKRRS